MKDIETLRAYLESLALAHPEFASELRFGPPLARSELLDLEQELELPQSYTQCLSKVGLAGVSIGYFELAPLGGQGPMRERLLLANTGDRPWKQLELDRHLVEVARWDVDPIFVVDRSQPDAGTVYQLDTDADRVQKIAPSFEAFLLRAGRLDQLREGGGASALQPFLTEIEDSGASNEEIDAWRLFATVALG